MTDADMRLKEYPESKADATASLPSALPPPPFRDPTRPSPRPTSEGSNQPLQLPSSSPLFLHLHLYRHSRPDSCSNLSSSACSHICSPCSSSSPSPPHSIPDPSVPQALSSLPYLRPKYLQTQTTPSIRPFLGDYSSPAYSGSSGWNSRMPISSLNEGCYLAGLGQIHDVGPTTERRRAANAGRWKVVGKGKPPRGR